MFSKKSKKAKNIQKNFCLKYIKWLKELGYDVEIGNPIKNK